jgi:hypothetical protein
LREWNSLFGKEKSNAIRSLALTETTGSML